MLEEVLSSMTFWMPLRIATNAGTSSGNDLVGSYAHSQRMRADSQNSADVNIRSMAWVFRRLDKLESSFVLISVEADMLLNNVRAKLSNSSLLACSLRANVSACGENNWANALTR